MTSAQRQDEIQETKTRLRFQSTAAEADTNEYGVGRH